mgnify:CR=1 FL=1
MLLARAAADATAGGAAGAGAAAPHFGADAVEAREDEGQVGAAHPDPVVADADVGLPVGVAVVTGSAFGSEGYIRLSFATSMANLEQALQRIAKALA